MKNILVSLINLRFSILNQSKHIYSHDTNWEFSSLYYIEIARRVSNFLETKDDQNEFNVLIKME